MVYIDATYFLMLLLSDKKAPNLIARDLFNQASQGKIRLTTSTLVIIELYYSLHSFYNGDRSRIQETLLKILNLSFLILKERDILENALILYKETNLSFEDCYNLSYAKKLPGTVLKTFDIKTEKIYNKLKDIQL